MKILVADDSPTMRKLLEGTLSSWGYEVVTACDGAEAWAFLNSEDPPPLVILDWMMPIFSGPELCSRVRERQSSQYIYILLLTSRSDREDVVQGLGSGADDYITKPFDLHELEVRLRAGRRIIDLQMELVRTQAALREQAMRDALTSCWNRASILSTLDREVARAEREGRPLALLMLDLDHFKNVNDTYGHAAGDRVLRETVSRLSASMRPYDYLGRYGGEEFLIILPGCDEESALLHADRLRMTVRAEPVTTSHQQLTVTASFGVTCYLPGSPLGVESLLYAADEALYQAKRAGRDRTVFLPSIAVTAPRR